MTIEGLTKPFYKCETCFEDLLAEQESIISNILERFPSARVVSQTQRLANAIFLLFPVDTIGNDADNEDDWIATLPGVAAVHGPHDYQPDFAETVAYLEGASSPLRETLCVTGAGVRVAVLDSGIDYTHAALDGTGTTSAYIAAYGTSATASANQQRQGLFPTLRVVEGYDFLGDSVNQANENTRVMDDDPIDGPRGHGTSVSSVIVAVAPNVELVAVKVCFSGIEGLRGCPDFAILEGLEYVLDINRDGNTDDRVDIVNVSLGTNYTSGYYGLLAKAMDDLFDMGILPIVSAGNSQNVPYIAGELATGINSFSAGSTGSSEIEGRLNTATSGNIGSVAAFSSRGPGVNNMIKPDIVAPGGYFPLALAGTGSSTFLAAGTSYSAPVLAGAAALVKEHCPECSPLAIKAILMNNALRTTEYSFSDSSLAPISLVGSGELQIGKMINADMWAYCDDDAQPSLSLGLINVVSDTEIRKTLRVSNLLNKAQTVNLEAVFRDSNDARSGAMEISFEPSSLRLSATCGSSVTVEVVFRISAANTPFNVMTMGGPEAMNPLRLDRNEFDGWIVLSTQNQGTKKDISVPFHSILRKASNLSIGNDVLPRQDSNPTVVDVNLMNSGAGPAQVDAFELIYISEDDAERPRGQRSPPSDFRYIGYRTLPVMEANCAYLVEFAIHTWEISRHPIDTVHLVDIDTNGDEVADLTLVNDGPLAFGAQFPESRIFDPVNQEVGCTGFQIDHSTNTATTILRACSNDLGMATSGTYRVGISSVTRPSSEQTDSTPWISISFPQPALSTASFDVDPGKGRRSLSVSGTGRTPDGNDALGLLLITHSFRSLESTGAATPATEALVVRTRGVNLPSEVTSDVLDLPRAAERGGPVCTWKEFPDNKTCADTVSPSSFTGAKYASASTASSFLRPTSSANLALSELNLMKPLQVSSVNGARLVCDLKPVPRSALSTESPITTPTPQPTNAPNIPIPASNSPTLLPTVSPIVAISRSPTMVPTPAPTFNVAGGDPSAIPSDVPVTTSASAGPTMASTTVPTILSTGPSFVPTGIQTPTSPPSDTSTDIPTAAPAGTPTSTSPSGPPTLVSAENPSGGTSNALTERGCSAIAVIVLFISLCCAGL